MNFKMFVVGMMYEHYKQYTLSQHIIYYGGVVRGLQCLVQ
jgi:hypothetical protein